MELLILKHWITDDDERAAWGRFVVLLRENSIVEKRWTAALPSNGPGPPQHAFLDNIHTDLLIIRS